jgi:hypothetical protein
MWSKFPCFHREVKSSLTLLQQDEGFFFSTRPLNWTPFRNPLEFRHVLWWRFLNMIRQRNGTTSVDYVSQVFPIWQLATESVMWNTACSTHVTSVKLQRLGPYIPGRHSKLPKIEKTAAKPKTLVTFVIDEISVKFQRLYSYFRRRQVQSSHFRATLKKEEWLTFIG